jgi:hypothetical protein
MAARGIAGLATNAGADKPFPITYLALEWLRVGGGTTLGGCRITARDSLGAIGSRHRIQEPRRIVPAVVAHCIERVADHGCDSSGSTPRRRMQAVFQCEADHARGRAGGLCLRWRSRRLPPLERTMATLDIRFAERMQAKRPAPAGLSDPAGSSAAWPLVLQQRPRSLYRSGNDDRTGRGMTTSI